MATTATVQLTTSDGYTIECDISTPDTGPIGGAVLCHPHPLYGGNRFHPMVDALFSSLPALGISALRLDFRSDHGGGEPEQLDVIAGLDELESRGSGPLVVVGYSFGAVVAASTTDERIRAVVAIAPPLASMPIPEPTRPMLVLTPRHDQFSPPEQTAPLVAEWDLAEFDVVESTDHFLAGRTALIADRATGWLAGRVRSECS